MITIPAKNVGGAISPAEPIPENAIAVYTDGSTYTVYVKGDEAQLALDHPPTPVDPAIERRAAIDAERDTRLAAGVTWDGDLWHTDNAFQTQITAIISAFNNGILQTGATVPMRTKANTVRTLSLAQLKVLAGTVMQYVQGVYAWSWQQKDAL